MQGVILHKEGVPPHCATSFGRLPPRMLTIAEKACREPVTRQREFVPGLGSGPLGLLLLPVSDELPVLCQHGPLRLSPFVCLESPRTDS